MILDREYIKHAFDTYCEKYDIDDPKIRLKRDHTYRVADLCETIAKDLGDASDPDLSWLCGMLHDIGRFEQVRIYNTFFDSISVDHAKFGADLLFNEGLIDRFGKFDDRILSILETSIRNHNRFRIEEGLSDEMLMYCRILRDADKIDIFRVNIDTPMEDIYNVSTKELKEAGVSDAVKAGFMEKHAVLRSQKETAVDYVVGHICLYYELEYPVSKRITRQQGYIDRLLSFESENEDTKKWFEYMRKNIWKGEIVQ